MTDAIYWHPLGTKGPWNLRDDDKRISVGIGLVDGPNGYDVAEVYNDDCDRDEAWTNARAIAEVPAMVMALREDVSCLSDLLCEEEPGTGDPNDDPLVDLLCRFRAILARIDGGA